MSWWVAGTLALMEALKLLEYTGLSTLGNGLEKSCKENNGRGPCDALQKNI